MQYEDRDFGTVIFPYSQEISVEMSVLKKGELSKECGKTRFMKLMRS